MDLFWCHEWLWAGAVCVKDCFFSFLFFFNLWFQASPVFLSSQHSLEVSTEMYRLQMRLNALWRRINNNQTSRTAPTVMFCLNRWDVMEAPLFFFLQHVWPTGMSNLRWSLNGKRRDEAGVRLTASWPQFHAASRFRGCCWGKCCCSLCVIRPSTYVSFIHLFTNSSFFLPSIPTIDQLIITIHLIAHHLSINVSATYSSIHYSSVNLWLNHPATHPSIY